MFWTGPGRVLIAWDMGQGPTWDAEAECKTLGECEVWRSVDPIETGSAAVPIGDTAAEGFLDTDVADGGVYYYWVMNELEGGGLHQIGPTMDVTVPSSWPADRDVCAPSDVDDLEATGVSTGIELTWKAASDGESGLLAYFVYDSNQDQPDSIVWADETVQDGSGQVASFIDLLPTGTTKSYIVCVIDNALNLSDGAGPVSATAAGGSAFGFWLTISAAHPTDASWLFSWPQNEPDPHHTIISRGFNADHSDAVILARLPFWDSNYATYRDYVCPDVDPDGNPYTYRIQWSNEAETILEDIEISTGPDLENAAVPASPLWVTGFMVEPDYGWYSELGDYADGDTDGWEWDGTPGASTSRETGGGETPRRNLAYCTQDPYASGYGPKWSSDAAPESALPDGCTSSAKYAPLHDDAGGTFQYGCARVDGIFGYWASFYVATDDASWSATITDEGATPANLSGTPGAGFYRVSGYILLPGSPEPTIDLLSPDSGPIGTVVTITGSYLMGVTGVSFLTADAVTFANVSDDEVTFTVPDGAETSVIYVYCQRGIAVSPDVFTVTA